MVKALIAAGANVNATMRFGTPLILAAQENRADNVTVLLESGAVANFRLPADCENADLAGKTALDIACTANAREVAPLLEMATGEQATYALPRPTILMDELEWGKQWDTDYDQLETIRYSLFHCLELMQESDSLECAFFLYQEYGIWSWRLQMFLNDKRNGKDAIHFVQEILPELWETHSMAIAIIAKVGRKRKIDTTPIELSAAYCRQTYAKEWLKVLAQMEKGNTRALRWPECLDCIPGNLTHSQIDTIMLAQIRFHQLFLAEGFTCLPDCLGIGSSVAAGPQEASNANNESNLTPSMKRILSLCRRKHYKGQTLASKLGLSFEHTRNLCARLAKMGRLKNHPAKGYHSV